MILYKMSDTNSVTGAKSSTDESTGTQLMGRCKWFNNKAGWTLTVGLAVRAHGME